MQRLKDRIKQQEGATARVQEMLQGLEGRLRSPRRRYPTLVFYQLRELWSLGRTLLTQFVAELAAQQEERERRAFFAEHNRQQFDAPAGHRSQAARGGESCRRRARGGRAARAAACSACGSSGTSSSAARCANGCRTASLQSLLCMQDLETARGARDALDAEPTPEFGGLSIDARRAINLATIAYAQLLVRAPGAHAAHGAGTQRRPPRREPPRDDYGDRARCEATMAAIASGRAGCCEQRGTLSPEIKQRSERVRELAKYRSAGDTVPTAESLVGRGRWLEGAGRRSVGDLPRTAALAQLSPSARGRGAAGACCATSRRIAAALRSRRRRP